MSKTYGFEEKKTEYNAKLGKECEVWQTPKYLEAKKKAIEIIENGVNHKKILSESDFWILMNATKSGKIAYTGLIISHNGCLKINDALAEADRFTPSCMTLDKDGYGGSLVYSYSNDAQGIYEVGEVSAKNCTNAYPYAMALKRCMDRVILKSSRLAYAGIYSDSEAEEFKNDPEEKKKTKRSAPVIVSEEGVKARKALVEYCKSKGIKLNDVAVSYELNNDSSDQEFTEALADLKDHYGEA